MRRWFDSFVRAFGPAPIILLLVTAAVSLADDAADLKRIIHAYADSPGDTLMLHARIAPGIVFDPEPLTWHPNIAFDTLHISNAGEANANAVPSFHNLKLCVANLNQMSSSQCRDWSSVWSKPAWHPPSNRPCQRGICSIVLLLSSAPVREPECSALPIIHLKKLSNTTNGFKNPTPGCSSCRPPRFHITATRSIADGDDPRLALLLNHQLALHSSILGTQSRGVVPQFPSDFSDMKNFFVGQEHIMGELKDILSLRKFDEGAKNSRVLVLVFAGVSGTGKTMLAELIANVIHGNSIDELKAEGKFFQQDMGSWQNPEDSDSLFGVKQASLRCTRCLIIACHFDDAPHTCRPPGYHRRSETCGSH